jgi:hypothetical protein
MPLINLYAATSSSPREPFVFPAIVEVGSQEECEESNANSAAALGLLLDSANSLFGAYVDGHE